MRKFNPYQGQSLIGIIIVLVVVGLFAGGLYYYLSKQIPEVPEIAEKPAEEEVVKPEKEVAPPPEEESPKKVTPPEEVVAPPCQDECSPIDSKKCSDNGYQTCANYDADNCLEWSSLTKCPQNTICQNGNCVQQKCIDGTSYGQCSTNKPKYCDNGILVNRCSACSCPQSQECQADGSCVISPASPPVSLKIDSCRTISTSGEYLLLRDLTNTKSEPCIKIQNVSNVTLDCQNYTITSKNENSNIYVKGGLNFKINNCKLVSSVNSLLSESVQHVLQIEDSKQGEIINNTIGGNYATINDSSFVTARNNTFNAQLSVHKSNNIVLRNNSFNFAGGGAVNIFLGDGNNNSLISNVLDGKSDGVFENKIGTDDIVFLDNEDNDVIQENTLQNAYECAIEFNRITGVKIISNKVNNTGLSFLCGWHYVSAKNITVKDNMVNNSPSLFWLWRERALIPNEQYVYFQDNLFENNKLTNPKIGTGFSFAALIDFNRPVIPLQNYRIGNNILRNNDFTKLIGPLRLAPANVIIDGGENICAGAEEEVIGGGSSISLCN